MASGTIRTSLTAKVLWVMAGLSLALVLLTSALEIGQERSDLIREEQREARAVVMADRDALALSLWSFDQRTLATIAHSLVQGTSIFRVEILSDGKLQLGAGPAAQSMRVDKQWEIPLSSPTTHQTLGSLRVFENYDSDRDQVRRRALMLVVGEVAKTFAISVFLFFLIHLWITQPLARLAGKVQETAGAAEKIAIRRFYHAGYDEIDALVDAVNYNQRERQRMELAERRHHAREAQTGKLAALGQLAGGIAHDFNNILGVILGFGGLLAQDLDGKPVQENYIRRLMAAAERGRDLVKQIVAFARVGQLERETVDLLQIVRQSESLLTATLPKTTALQFELSGEALPIRGNAVQLGQLVVNLCVNASEALGGKAGTVTVQVARADAEELRELSEPAGAGEHFAGTLDPERDYARLRICDSGEGIAPALLERIFEPFFTTKGRQHGTGLGLAVVHRVVESHGGAYHLRSNAQSGSVFSIYLPLSNVPLAAATPPRLPWTQTAGRERLLIVDDEPDIVDMLVAGFERLGYQAVGVTDPLEALAAFQEAPDAFDLVITDQIMPSMPGLELARRLKAIAPAVKIILCTGYSDTLGDTRPEGADAFHIKPVDARGLAPTIRALVDGPP